MFKQLHRRMLFIHLSILTVLLLAVFGVLYGTTYANVQARIDDELVRLVDFDFFGFWQDDPHNTFTPDRTVSFVVLLDDSDELLASFTQFTADDDFLEQAIESATKAEGKFELDEYYWAYLQKETDNGTIIAYVDITNETIILRELLARFALIFVGSFILVAVISNFITKRSIKPVKETFNRQKQFIADASHELKTPLTVINTNIDVLLSKTNKQNEKWLQYIQSEVIRMNKLTHDLLYLANVSEMEEHEIVKSDLNISSSLESILLGIEALAYEKQITIDYNLEEEVHVLFNKEQFHQVLMIVLDNAIKYANQAGKIDVNLASKNNYAVITVTNTGDGIPEEELDHLFDRFYKVDKSREHKSNSFGLGLSIAKSIIDNNHGKITIESIVNESTTVTIRLKIK